ncbi:hypothetical protein BDZ97DRAFT_1914154 [Flammula alnicola]|nr:hypothetical protein BDZ97DRAFT_1914154 [Flammula alnicola]
MAQSKRQKSTGNSGKKPGSAKQALKKKYLSSNKSRNDDLREKLDRDAASLLTIHAITEPQLLPKLPTSPDVDISHSLTDVTSILRNL